MSAKYECYINTHRIVKSYTFGGGITVIVPSIAEAKEGFWINRDMKFTNGEDGLFWIPPSSILLVRKLK